MSKDRPTHVKDTKAMSGGIQLSRTSKEVDKKVGPFLDWAGVDCDDVVVVREDFVAAAGTTLPAPWAEQDTSAAGTPTTDYVSGDPQGIYRLATDATNEAQRLTLYFGDNLVIPPTARARFSARIKIDTDSAGGLTADDRIVVGLASARNATLDSVADHAWFRLEGANQNILCETDDGTTDNDDNDTGVDWAEATYVKLTIDVDVQGDVRFLVDDADVTPETMSLAAAVAGDKLQPFIEIQKDAGTEAHTLDIDWVEVAWVRS